MGTLWSDLLGSETRFYDAGGIRTRSIEAGSGAAVLFLHGIGATAETFSRNVIPFSEHFNARAIDILGHGMSGTIAGPLSKDAFIDHVLDYMDAAGIDHAHLVGNSLGGWLAMWIALTHPERVGKVVNVVGSHLSVDVGEHARLQAQSGLENLKRLSQRLAEEPTCENLRARLGYVFLHVDRDLTDELVDVRWKLFQRSTNGKQVSDFVGNPGPENLLTPERLAKVAHPTLLLWTDHNPSTATEAAETAATYLPKGRLALMSDCGHWPQWEDAATFNRIVIAFLRS